MKDDWDREYWEREENWAFSNSELAQIAAVLALIGVALYCLTVGLPHAN